MPFRDVRGEYKAFPEFLFTTATTATYTTTYEDYCCCCYCCCYRALRVLCALVFVSCFALINIIHDDSGSHPAPAPRPPLARVLH